MIRTRKSLRSSAVKDLDKFMTHTCLNVSDPGEAKVEAGAWECLDKDRWHQGDETWVDSGHMSDVELTRFAAGEHVGYKQIREGQNGSEMLGLSY